MNLDRSAILARSNLPSVLLEVPEWDGVVFVKTMSGTERDRFEAEHIKAPTSDFRARMAVATLCDESGAPLFTPADTAAVGALSSAALDRVMDIALKINKFSKADVEDLRKN